MREVAGVGQGIVEGRSGRIAVDGRYVVEEWSGRVAGRFGGSE